MTRGLANLGAATLRQIEELGRMIRFGARIVMAASRPPFRWRAFMAAVYDSGVLSVALICAAGLTVGFVLGLQLYNTLVRFGAEDSLGTAVGLSLIRELGPVLTGLLVTGRAGSAITAEIGAMRTGQQLDGLRMMAIDPIHFVVMPRAMAIFFVLPLLSALFVSLGIFGAYLIGVELLGLDGGTFLASLEAAVEFDTDVLQSLVKSVVFGVLLALIATWRGYSCEPHSAGVSRATTSTVVTASIAILLADYLLTALWSL
ncbi:MAG: MlaE family lipid ABC transporter permease subunit [Myxococcota bacterium]|jgi:phospholipid/cholesterol/gamma-HCH transport system permease protein|nr:MlaE family lipid ABC transporter permease subunit [Myxococcota bacterium]